LSQDQPDIEEILTTVREFAENVARRSSGAERYDALCAAFLMGVVQRELDLGERQDARQLTQLQGLIDGQGNLAELYKVFGREVRSGGYDHSWQQAFEFALDQVIDKVRVTNPDHLEARHREGYSTA
jgi:hypothetical protein